MEKEQKRRGRPPLSPAGTTTISIVLDNYFLQALQSSAKSAGQNFSEYMRDMIKEAWMEQERVKERDKIYK